MKKGKKKSSAAYVAEENVNEEQIQTEVAGSDGEHFGQKRSVDGGELKSGWQGEFQAENSRPGSRAPSRPPSEPSSRRGSDAGMEPSKRPVWSPGAAPLPGPGPDGVTATEKLAGLSEDDFRRRLAFGGSFTKRSDGEKPEAGSEFRLSRQSSVGGRSSEKSGSEQKAPGLLVNGGEGLDETKPDGGVEEGMNGITETKEGEGERESEAGGSVGDAEGDAKPKKDEAPVSVQDIRGLFGRYLGFMDKRDITGIGQRSIQDIAQLGRKTILQTYRLECTVPADMVRGGGRSEAFYRLRSFVDPAIQLVTLGHRRSISLQERQERRIKSLFLLCSPSIDGKICKADAAGIIHAVAPMVRAPAEAASLDPENKDMITCQRIIEWYMSNQIRVRPYVEKPAVRMARLYKIPVDDEEESDEEEEEYVMEGKPKKKSKSKKRSKSKEDKRMKKLLKKKHKHKTEKHQRKEGGEDDPKHEHKHKHKHKHKSRSKSREKDEEKGRTNKKHKKDKKDKKHKKDKDKAMEEKSDLKVERSEIKKGEDGENADDLDAEAIDDEGSRPHGTSDSHLNSSQDKRYGMLRGDTWGSSFGDMNPDRVHRIHNQEDPEESPLQAPRGIALGSPQPFVSGEMRTAPSSPEQYNDNVMIPRGHGIPEWSAPGSNVPVPKRESGGTVVARSPSLSTVKEERRGERSRDMLIIHITRGMVKVPKRRWFAVLVCGDRQLIRTNAVDPPTHDPVWDEDKAVATTHFHTALTQNRDWTIELWDESLEGEKKFWGATEIPREILERVPSNGSGIEVPCELMKVGKTYQGQVFVYLRLDYASK